MKQVLAVYCDKYTNPNGFGEGMHWEYYTLNEDKTWHLKEDGYGWKIETLDLHKLHSHRNFIFADSMVQIKALIKESDFVREHGEREKEEYDFVCPNCGYTFNSPEPSMDCEYGGIFLDDKHFNIDCLCGKKIIVRVDYKIKKKISVELFRY